MFKRFAGLLTAFMLVLACSPVLASATPESIIADFENANPTKKDVTSRAQVQSPGTQWNEAIYLIDGDFTTHIVRQTYTPYEVAVALEEELRLSDVFVYIDPGIGVTDDARMMEIQFCYADGTRDTVYQYGNDPALGMLRLPSDSNMGDSAVTVIKQNMKLKKITSVALVKPADSPSTRFTVTDVRMYAEEIDLVERINIAQGKPLFYAPEQTFFSDDVTAVNIVDGTEGTFMFASPPSGGGDPAWIKVDLGNYYPIDSIAITPRLQEAGGNEYDALDLMIKGSRENVAVSEMETIALTPSGIEQMPLGVQWEHRLEDEKVYRYIAVARQEAQRDNPMCFTELYVYTKIPVAISGWQVAGAESGMIEAGKDYTVSFTVKNNTEDECKFLLLTGIYGEADIVLKTEALQITTAAESETPFNIPLNVPSDTVRVSIAMLDSLANGMMKTEALNLNVKETQSETVNPPEGEGYVFEAEEKSFVIYGKLGEALTATDRLSMLVLYPDKDFNSPETEEGIILASEAISEAAGVPVLRLNMPDGAPYGIYTVRLVKTDYLGNTETYPFKWNYISKDDIKGMMTELQGADAENVRASMLRMKEELAWDFEDICPSLPDDIGKYFVLAREGNKLGMLTSEAMEFTSFKDVRSNLQQALVLRDLSGEINIAGLSEDMKHLPAIFKGMKDAETFAELYKKVRKEEETKEYFETIKRCAILSQIQNGSREDIARLMEENAQLLGFDPSYVSGKNVTYDEIVKYIDVKNIEKYAAGGMLSDVQAATGKVLDEKQTQKVTGISGGGGGGGKGSGGTRVVASQPAVNKNIPEIQAGNKKISFGDIEAAEWAHEAIEVLYGKGIINGVSAEAFEPDRAVTRAEFVKMVVCAFDIVAVGNESPGFDDCDITSWYYSYVKAAYNNGIIRGIGGAHFGADSEISRQDVAVILDRVMEIKKKIATPTGEKEFTDENSISEYAKEAVMAVCGAGITDGFPDGTFRPNEKTTRAQTAVMIYRLMQYFE